MQNFNEYGSYPNTEFPYNYTKSGQKAMMDRYMSSNSQVNISSHQSEPSQNIKEDNSQVNTMSSNSNLDMSKLLPLLLNKNLSTNELIDALLPMFNKSNLPIKDLLNLTHKSDTTTSTLPTKEPIITQGYKKVE